MVYPAPRDTPNADEFDRGRRGGAGGTFYALTYVVLFAIPLFGLRDVNPRPPAWLRVVSLSGMLMTLLYVALAVFPIIKVASVASFALKISLLIVGANVVGALIFYGAQRRRSQSSVFTSS